jgi:hypothetical protein
METPRSNVSKSLLLALPSSLAWACAPDEAEDARAARAVHAAETVAPEAEDETLVYLEGRYGELEGLRGDVKYKIERTGGRRFRQLELEVENAEPGTAYDLTLDGLAFGRGVVSRKGALQLEISEEDGQLFPAGFCDPVAGSVFRVGELLELRFDNLERLTHLEAAISGPGALSGKVSFKVDRLGDVVSREFRIKVEEAPPKTVQAVTLDGVHVADLSLDVEGRGRLKFSTKEPAPFPDVFPEPREGSVVQVGDLFRQELQDRLAPASAHGVRRKRSSRWRGRWHPSHGVGAALGRRRRSPSVA